MIKVNKLFKQFGSQVVLNEISFEIKPGELLVILGESGSGKSVLLQHLIGLIKPDHGVVEIEGRDITKLRESDLLRVRRDMGYLFQDGALYDFMTVYENAAFPLREHTRLKRKDIKTKVLDILKMVDLKGAEGKFPSQLSGGMRKRAALARAVIMDSKILFCDEPTSGLDPIKSRNIMDLINTIVRKLKCTTVIASHDIINSLRIADRLILIRQGQIVAAGTPAELRSSKDAYLQEFFN
ncbi:MAG: ATP-binding cassette domain-containing protein [Candidatus Omnitrophica bacterium]|nr:ATP-binding cassette domain-containing protein [Candidatus Omnitrophota bacterium]